MSSPCFDTLPVELIHRIFDCLDVKTILLSVRHTCQRLYSATNTYNRYHFNFKSIAKPYFRFICENIPFENVISLTLSDEDKTRGQIQFFLSLFSIEKFTRLQSLSLFQINETHLTIFTKYISNASLKSLAISTPIVHIRGHKTPSLLSTAIANNSIENLYLTIWTKDWKDLHWPMNSSLNYLRIVNYITLKQLCIILEQSPNLRTLVLKEVDDDDTENTLVGISYPQVSSLIFDDGFIDINKLEKCVSLIPSLTYLKLIGTGSLFNSSFDGFRWEKMIRTKLNSLKKLEFFVQVLTHSNYRSRNIEILMNSFRTSFWLQDIPSFINCDFITNSHKILLYTLPICNNRFVYHSDLRKISSSNRTIRLNQNDMNCVRKLQIQLTRDLSILTKEKNESSNSALFRNVTNLTIENTGEWPQSSLQFLSIIVDLSLITKLSLSINFITEYMFDTVKNITSLLNKTLNLRSLLLFDYWAPDNCMERMETICSIIPSHVKHLKIRVKNIDDIKYILESLIYLTSITFEYAQILSINREDFVEFLSSLNRYSSLWDSRYALNVWLGPVKRAF